MTEVGASSLLCLRADDRAGLRAATLELRGRGREVPSSGRLTLSVVSTGPADLAAKLEEAARLLEEDAPIDRAGALHFQPDPWARRPWRSCSPGRAASTSAWGATCSA